MGRLQTWPAAVRLRRNRDAVNCYRVVVRNVTTLRDKFDHAGVYRPCRDGVVYVMASTAMAAAEAFGAEPENIVSIEEVGVAFP